MDSLKKYNEAKKILTAGIVLQSGSKVFLIKPTGLKVWGFPKGHIEKGEDVFTGAKREFVEETGIQLPNDKSLFKDIGTFDIGQKTLHLWVYQGTGKEKFISCNLIDSGPMKGRPENNAGAYWEIEKAYKVVFKGLDKVLDKLTS